ncbi:lipocalin, partial [Cellulomonas rhizosphaerae]
MTRRLFARAAAIAAVAVLGVSLAAPANAAKAPPQPVASVDVAKYVGSWYQVAAVPA